MTDHDEAKSTTTTLALSEWRTVSRQRGTKSYPTIFFDSNSKISVCARVPANEAGVCHSLL